MNKMVILIGGAGFCGKTLMAQRLLEVYKYPYLSIDHLKMGIYRADNGCGFTPEDDFELIAKKLWGILKGIIMTNIENGQNIIIEGVYLLPNLINELESRYLKEIISFYMLFSPEYIMRNFENVIMANKSTIEARGYEIHETMGEYLALTKRMKDLYDNHGGNVFELEGDYERETDNIREWIESAVRG